MQRYFLELSYKGTAYSGFQIQDNANTIQAEVQRALEIIFRQPFELTGSSRTDAGVHACQNYFHFDSDLVFQNKHLYSLNALVPEDISIKGIFPVPATAHCRFDAVAREYNYFIYRQKNPFLADRGWMYPYPLNLDLLNQSAHGLMKHTDFTSFSKRNTQVKSFLCSLEASEWHEEEGNLLVYRVKANRFLRGMVRGLVGTMLKVARSQLSIEDFHALIEAKNCANADFSTPAHGLFLNRIFYNDTLIPYLKGG